VVGDDGDAVVETDDLANPRTAIALPASTRRRRPPTTGDCISVATFMPGTCASMP
jgi:hypothetical protein